MSKLSNGSLCLTDINAAAKAGHSAFSKANNGKIYFNVNIWHNEKPDNYGHTIGIQLQSKKDKRESEGKVYIGNAKPSQLAEAQPVSGSDIPDDDSLPF